MATKKKKASRRSKAEEYPLAAPSAAEPQPRKGRTNLWFNVAVVAVVTVFVLKKYTFDEKVLPSSQASMVLRGEVIPNGRADKQVTNSIGVQGDKEDNLFYLDTAANGSKRLQKFSPLNKFLAKYAPKNDEEGIEGAVDVSVDELGQPWVLRSSGEIKVISADLKAALKTLRIQVPNAWSLGLDNNGRAYVLSKGDSNVYVLDKEGQTITKFGSFTEPVFLRVTPSGLAVVVDQKNGGLYCHVYGLDMKKKRSFSLGNYFKFQPWTTFGVNGDDRLVVNDQQVRNLVVFDLKKGAYLFESVNATNGAAFQSPGSCGANSYSGSIFIHSGPGLARLLAPEGR